MELGSAFPETGGGYLWIRRAMKDPLGFLGGWMSWFSHTIVASFYIFGFGLAAVVLIKVFGGIGTLTIALGPLVLDEAALYKVFAVTAAGAFIWLNYRGTKLAGRSETAVAVGLIIIACAFIVLGLFSLFTRPTFPWENFQPFFVGNGAGPQALALFGAMGFTFIVFEGYEIIAQTGEEVRNPERNIPRAHFIVIGVSTVIFILMAFVGIGLGGSGTPPCLAGGPACLLTSTGIGNNNAIAEMAAKVMPYGLPIVVFGIALGALASLNSLIYSSSRVAFAMGRDGTLPRALGRLHPKKRTPHLAIAVSGSITILMTLSLDINTVAASADIMFLLLFLMVNWAAIVLRRTMPDVKRYFITPWFPVIPILGIITKLIVAMSLWAYEPGAWLIALAWLGVGLGIHYLYEKKEVVASAARAVGVGIPAARPRYRILLPIDDFERTGLVDFAALVGRVEGGELTLLHVVEVPDTLPVDALERSYVAELRRGLGGLRRRAEEAGVEATARVEVSHRLVDAVLDNVRNDETNLMILGWRGGTRKGRILGSNVDRFVQEAPCDVVVFKTAGMKPKLDRILILNAPEWHVSYATGYAILLAKKHKAAITVFSVVQTDLEAAKERVYSARLAEMCKTFSVPFEERLVKARSIVDAVVEEAKGHDLLVLGASGEWRLTQFAFGAMQDQIARRVEGPVLMMRKVRREEVAARPPS